MAGNALMYGVVGFIAGVVLGSQVRTLVQEHLGFEIPSFYADSYPAIDYDTTRSSFTGSVTERDYDSELETHINHLPMD